MSNKILIVEDEFIVANDLEMKLKKAGYQVCGIAESYQEALEIIDTEKPNWVLLDIFIKGDRNGIDIAKQLNKRNIGFIYISANSNQRILEMARSTQPYGFIVKPFREKDLLIMLDIAQSRHEQTLNIAQMQIGFNQQKIQQLTHQLELGPKQLAKILEVLHNLLPFDVLVLKLEKGISSEPYEFTLIRNHDQTFQHYELQQLLEMMKLDLKDYAKLNANVQHCHEIRLLNGNHFSRLLLDLGWMKRLSTHFELGSVIQLPLSPNSTFKYSLNLYSREKETYYNAHLETAGLMTGVLNDALDAVFNKKTATSYMPNNALAAPADVRISKNSDLPDRTEIDGIIGKSPLLLKVLERTKLVAASDATVLIYGESGTGKERSAKSIHQLSARKNKPLVVLNCAALPANLIESELFGHEKGAFTGANEKRVGKFEQADGGTIFLDEIGEMPLELQIKLLRVLQEKEIEKIGGNKTLKIDVRVIAATNRNLEKEVAEDRFRLDLYYRLNVFPITLPSLRERVADIQALATYFISKFTPKGRLPKIISTTALQKLQHYTWPGNIRELEHLIERTIILTPGNEINDVELPVTINNSSKIFSNNQPLLRMDDMERNYILSVLQSCNGKVSGQGGAAQILGMPTSTLNSRMQKLGIKKEGANYIAS
ncbi:MAG: response regulator [Chitinophagaceae bacterium]|nr:MAG: response regulator [Chitinophagaceae bacterium]